MRTFLLTALALLAFAGNSVLCRLALDAGWMDAVGFTAVRLFFGALMLLLLLLLRHTPMKAVLQPSRVRFTGALMLFVYALSFSLAYLQLTTGSGALILFGVVQLTLLLADIMAGKRPHRLEWAGVVLAFVGLVYLLAPAWGTPTVAGFALMSLSGVAWGVYTWLGRGSSQPLVTTAANFVWSLPWVLLMCLFSFKPQLWTTNGLILAASSGALTSGLGYALWYAVLPKLTSAQAGIYQLLVPIIAAIGGVLFAAEAISVRLVVASSMVLGGIYLVLLVNKHR